MVSTTSGLEHVRIGRWLLLLCLTLLGTGCASRQVVVEGKFPTPLLDPLPITLGVIYPQAFAEHEFFDEAKGRYAVRLADGVQGDVMRGVVRGVVRGVGHASLERVVPERRHREVRRD